MPATKRPAPPLLTPIARSDLFRNSSRVPLQNQDLAFFASSYSAPKPRFFSAGRCHTVTSRSVSFRLRNLLAVQILLTSALRSATEMPRRAHAETSSSTTNFDSPYMCRLKERFHALGARSLTRSKCSAGTKYAFPPK